MFSLSVATALKNNLINHYDVMHLHDWHAAMVAMLRSCVTEFSALQNMPCIFTIHNLALQGIRPYSGDESSFCHWFPQYVSTLLPIANTSVFDPRYTNSINPMRMGVLLSDIVHLVSPTYAEEVLKSSDYQKGFLGGEGLEADLKAKVEMGCVIGIINGCMYENMPKMNLNNPRYHLLICWWMLKMRC